MTMRETIEAAEAAEILGLSTWTLYDLARRHAIPHVRVGRRVLFRRASILAWLDAQEALSTGPETVSDMKLNGTRVPRI